MVQIIPKVEKKPLNLQIIFLIFSIAVLFFSFFLFIYFKISEKGTNEEIAILNEKISSLKTPEIDSLEKEVLKYQDKISNFSKILGGHLFSSKFFPALEENTLKKISFSRINLDFKNSKCILSGKAPDFYTLQQQLDIFKGVKSFQTNLSRIFLGKEGTVEFEFEIIFDKSIVK
jgi:hypothetical protein